MDGLGPLPDGWRRKVERVGKKADQKDLDEFHVNTNTPDYRHPVRPSLPHPIEAWDRLLLEGLAS